MKTCIACMQAYTRIISGAYKPTKAMKEDETLFHDNPNYAMTFEIW